MKHLFTILLILSLSSALYAQNRISFGLKAGPNLAWQRIDPLVNEKSPIFSAHVTGYAEFPLTRKFSLQPGISLQGKGAKTDIGSWQDVPDGGKLGLMYLEIPVNLIYKFPVKKAGNFFAGAGPYVALGLDGKIKYSSGSERDHIFKSIPGGNGFNKTDFGLNFLTGTSLSSHLTLSAQFGLGLITIAPEPYTANGSFITLPKKDNIRNRVASVSVGYGF